jgi:hypothetical protein
MLFVLMLVDVAGVLNRRVRIKAHNERDACVKMFYLPTLFMAG